MRHRRSRRVALVALAWLIAAPAAAEVPPLPLVGDGVTVRVSTRADGSQATGRVAGYAIVDQPSISANGRYVVFYTTLRLGLGSCPPGTYLRDLKTGRLEMISIPARGCSGQTDGYGSAQSYTSVTPDGRYVAFASGAHDLVPGRTLPQRSPFGNHTQQIFLRDRARQRTALVSVGYDGKPANASAYAASVSDDGRFVVFDSSATNLVRGDFGDGSEPHESRTDVFLRDMRRGVTVRVGPNIRRSAKPMKLFPSISGNGRYVVFDADDGNLVPHRGPGGVLGFPVCCQVYVWDRITGKLELVSRSDDNHAADAVATLRGNVGSKISRDGRWIVFTSLARNLTGQPTAAGLEDPGNIFLFDRVNKKIRRVTDGLAGEGGNGESDDPCISANGRWVSFASAASNLGDVDATPGYWEGLPDAGTDIYLYDRDTKRTRLVSRSTEGIPANLNSKESCPSDDGTVVFVSRASTLVPGDTNDVADLFVRRYPRAT